MDRSRALWSISAVMAISLLLAACAPEDDEAPEEDVAVGEVDDEDATPIRIAHCVSQTHSFHLAAEYLGERLDELAPGAFELQLFPDCELGDEVTLFDLYPTDDVEMTIQYSSSAASVAQPMGFLAIPFQLDDHDHWERVMLDPATTDLLDEKLEDAGVNFRIGSTGSFGVRNIYSIDPIDTSSLEGFEGLRMRETESPIMIEVWEAVGINPVAIPFPELYSALESGVVEAAPNTPVGYDLGSHYEVAPHYHFTEHEATSSFIFVRENWYSELPADLQDALDQAFLETNDFWNETNLEHNQEVLDQFDELGVTAHDVPQEVRDEIAAIVAPILERAAEDFDMEDYLELVDAAR